jgi:regulator of sigma E protease
MQSARMGFVFLLQLMGMISLNLAALNVLPFPALDGGRLLFVIIEKIKGSRLTPRFETYANGLGFFALISLILAVTIRDIAHLL